MPEQNIAPPAGKAGTIEVGSVDVVIPIYNESDNIDALLGRSLQALSSAPYAFRLLLVDDGSSDDSVGKIRGWIAKEPGKIMLVRLNRNYGQHAAIIAGFEHCDADAVVTIDADLQNPPEEIPALIAKMQEGYDVVGSVRRIRKDNVLRRLASRTMNRLVRRLTKVNMTDYGCMLRAYHRDVIKAILQCEERFIYIPVLANSFATHSVEVMVEHHERAAGDSKYNYWKLFTLFFDILTGTTFMPLRLLTVLGVGMCGASAIFGALLLVLRFCYGTAWGAYGVFTLFGVLFFFVGIQFFTFGVMGEYICRISMDVRKRPKYLIASMEGAVKE